MTSLLMIKILLLCRFSKKNIKKFKNKKIKLRNIAIYLFMIIIALLLLFIKIII
jgi:hypothetical protein